MPVPGMIPSTITYSICLLVGSEETMVNNFILGYADLEYTLLSGHRSSELKDLVAVLLDGGLCAQNGVIKP